MNIKNLLFCRGPGDEDEDPILLEDPNGDSTIVIDSC